MNKQSGKIDILVIVVLVVALIAGLAYVFWKNTAQEDQSSTTDSDSRQQAVALESGQSSDAFVTGVSWQYPADWKLTTTGDEPASADDTALQVYSLLSPTGEIEVVYTVGQNLGIGGSCLPDEFGKITHARHDRAVQDPKFVFVEWIGEAAMSESEGSGPLGYKYGASLAPNTDAVGQVKAGDSMCEVGMIHYLDLPESSAAMVTAEVKLVDLSSETEFVEPVAEQSVISDYFDSAEYKQAVDILKSTKSRTNN